MANACGVDGLLCVYDDAVFNGHVFEHSHKLAHCHELPVLLGSLQSDGIFIVLMLRGLREKTGLNYQPSSTLLLQVTTDIMRHLGMSVLDSLGCPIEVHGHELPKMLFVSPPSLEDILDNSVARELLSQLKQSLAPSFVKPRRQPLAEMLPQ